MPLIDCIKKQRDTTRTLLYISVGWLREESKDDPRTYTSAEVLGLLEAILENGEVPNAGDME